VAALQDSRGGKVRQIMLVQVVKGGTRQQGCGAHDLLSLARALMRAHAQHGTRRLASARKIHQRGPIARTQGNRAGIEVPRMAAGLIVRTAGAQRTKAEIQSATMNT